MIGGIDAKCANIDFRQDFCMTFLNFQNCAIDDLWCKLFKKLNFLKFQHCAINYLRDEPGCRKWNLQEKIFDSLSKCKP